jgi:hypothetical protein
MEEIKLFSRWHQHCRNMERSRICEVPHKTGYFLNAAASGLDGAIGGNQRLGAMSRDCCARNAVLREPGSGTDRLFRGTFSPIDSPQHSKGFGVRWINFQDMRTARFRS